MGVWLEVGHWGYTDIPSFPSPPCPPCMHPDCHDVNKLPWLCPSAMPFLPLKLAEYGLKLLRSVSLNKPLLLYILDVGYFASVMRK